METRVCRLYGAGDIRIESETVAEPLAGEVLVRVGAGGICGSDLHYYQDGGFGPIRVKEPIILGHEVAGTVAAVGEGVTNVRPGDRVALNPSRPCGNCSYCAQGLHQHCMNMRFYGSAMRFPHEQGGFRDLIVADAAQCHKVGSHTSLAQAACAEPLSVCLHAARQAIEQTGGLAGKKILVTGAGPIGALCVAVARHEGASEIVVTDLQDATLAVASKMGATQAINVASDADKLDPHLAGKGTFDVVFECSAAAPAMRTALAATKPRGTIVQLGVTGDMAFPINVLVGKEIVLRGTHRFHAEYAEAVRLIDSGAIDVRPIITAHYPLERALEAFEIAGNRAKSVKVQLTFA